jgi:hypothetical protein
MFNSRFSLRPVWFTAKALLFGTGLFSLCLCLQSSSWAEDNPIEFRLEASKQIFSHSEGLVMILSWLAKKPVKLCLAKDLLSQTQVEVSRSGRGKLTLQPLVIEDKSKLFDMPSQILNLQTGQSVRRRVNLKRFHFSEGEHWDAGDYTVKASFSLCAGEGKDEELRLPAKAPAYFMLMD